MKKIYIERFGQEPELIGQADPGTDDEEIKAQAKERFGADVVVGIEDPDNTLPDGRIAPTRSTPGMLGPDMPPPSNEPPPNILPGIEPVVQWGGTAVKTLGPIGMGLAIGGPAGGGAALARNIASQVVGQTIPYVAGRFMESYGAPQNAPTGPEVLNEAIRNAGFEMLVPGGKFARAAANKLTPTLGGIADFTTRTIGGVASTWAGRQAEEATGGRADPGIGLLDVGTSALGGFVGARAQGMAEVFERERALFEPVKQNLLNLGLSDEVATKILPFFSSKDTPEHLRQMQIILADPQKHSELAGMLQGVPEAVRESINKLIGNIDLARDPIKLADSLSTTGESLRAAIDVQARAAKQALPSQIGAEMGVPIQPAGFAQAQQMDNAAAAMMAAKQLKGQDEVLNLWSSLQTGARRPVTLDDIRQAQVGMHDSLGRSIKESASNAVAADKLLMNQQYEKLKKLAQDLDGTGSPGLAQAGQPASNVVFTPDMVDQLKQAWRSEMMGRGQKDALMDDIDTLLDRIKGQGAVTAVEQLPLLTQIMSANARNRSAYNALDKVRSVYMQVLENHGIRMGVPQFGSEVAAARSLSTRYHSGERSVQDILEEVDPSKIGKAYMDVPVESVENETARTLREFFSTRMTGKPAEFDLQATRNVLTDAINKSVQDGQVNIEMLMGQLQKSARTNPVVKQFSAYIDQASNRAVNAGHPPGSPGFERARIQAAEALGAAAKGSITSQVLAMNPEAFRLLQDINPQLVPTARGLLVQSLIDKGTENGQFSPQKLIQAIGDDLPSKVRDFPELAYLVDGRGAEILRYMKDNERRAFAQSMARAVSDPRKIASAFIGPEVSPESVKALKASVLGLKDGQARWNDIRTAFWTNNILNPSTQQISFDAMAKNLTGSYAHTSGVLDEMLDSPQAASALKTWGDMIGRMKEVYDTAGSTGLRAGINRAEQSFDLFLQAMPASMLLTPTGAAKAGWATFVLLKENIRKLRGNSAIQYILSKQGQEHARLVSNLWNQVAKTYQRSAEPNLR